MTLALFIALLAAVSLALALVMTAAWIVQQRTGNSGWVDTIWTFGLGTIGIITALLPLSPDATGVRRVLVATLVAAWALRLGFHIALRSAGISDDPRYAKLRGDWGPDAPRQMFWLLQSQALVSIPLAISISLAAQNPAPQIRTQDIIAVAVLIVGILGETVADLQLRRFRRKAANKARICDAGLWKWSRHPNYFFEWFGWLAYPLLATDLTGAYAWGWLALAGPACMYWLLVYVSGIPPLEQHMLETRPDAFRAYQARTSAFFPLPPQSSRSDVPA